MVGFHYKLKTAKNEKAIAIRSFKSKPRSHPNVFLKRIFRHERQISLTGEIGCVVPEKGARLTLKPQRFGALKRPPSGIDAYWSYWAMHVEH